MIYDDGSTPDFADGVWVKAVHVAKSFAAENIRRVAQSGAFTCCESPIEQLLLLSIMATSAEGTARYLNWPCYIESLVERAAASKAVDLPSIFIAPQVTVGKYRVDIAIACSRADMPPFVMAIECDGHEFHEKTKKQAARDKARDRYLVSRGMAVVRFSGSEIWNSPAKCADEAVGIFEAAIGDAFELHMKKTLEQIKSANEVNDDSR